MQPGTRQRLHEPQTLLMRGPGHGLAKCLGHDEYNFQLFCILSKERLI